MCLGTYIVSYSCGHVASTPNVCLRDVASHYRCEPRGMKITQPNGRCVECYARNLSPHQHLTTTARFNPDPKFVIEERQTLTPQSSLDSSERNAAITRWIMEIPALGPGAVHIERGLRRSTCSLTEALAEQGSQPDYWYSQPATSSTIADARGYEADYDDDDSL